MVKWQGGVKNPSIKELKSCTHVEWPNKDKVVDIFYIGSIMGLCLRALLLFFQNNWYLSLVTFPPAVTRKWRRNKCVCVAGPAVCIFFTLKERDIQRQRAGRDKRINMRRKNEKGSSRQQTPWNMKIWTDLNSCNAVSVIEQMITHSTRSRSTQQKISDPM